MGRTNYLVTMFSQIALEQFQMLKEDYEELKCLKIMCVEAVILKQEICNHYVTTITFAAMSMEAFLNDYAATRMGDAFFYDNFENLRPFAKLQLISKMLLHTTIDKGGKIYDLMNQLFRERNQLVHCKSKELVGMSEEELMNFQRFLETDKNAELWLASEVERMDIEEEKEMLQKAKEALQALIEVARFIDSFDGRAFSEAKLLYSGWYVDGRTEQYERIKCAQIFLGIEPIVLPDRE